MARITIDVITGIIALTATASAPGVAFHKEIPIAEFV